MNVASAYNILPYNQPNQLVPYSGNADTPSDYTSKQTHNDQYATEKKLKYYVKSSVDDVMYNRKQLTTKIISEAKGSMINLYA